MTIKFKNIDSHFVINFLGITIRIKHNFSKANVRRVKEYGLNRELRDKKVIVSLTTFPERITKVHLTIEQLLTQTFKPDKVILWLAEEQFPKKEEELPETLLRLKEFGLDIEWCEDLKSYKKLLPTLREYPNDIIITYDDDIYYEKDSVERLYNAYLSNKDCICTHRNAKIYFDKNDKLRFHKSKHLYFNNESADLVSFFNTIIGCGGVLYPPNCLYHEIHNTDLIKQTIPSQDDIWFWAMAILKGTKIKIVNGFSRSLLTIEDTQNYGLCKKNSSSKTGLSGNEALEIIIKQFPEILEILRKDSN